MSLTLVRSAPAPATLKPIVKARHRCLKNEPKREYWPSISYRADDEVLVKLSARVYLLGKIVGVGAGISGETLYTIQVGIGRILVRTLSELSE